MRTKGNIRKKFKSLKFCSNVYEYLQQSKIENVTDQVIEYIQRDIISLPSIFELFMYRYSEFEMYSKDYSKLKKMLLDRYIKFIKNAKNGKYTNIFDFDVALFNLDKFLYTLSTHISEKRAAKTIYDYLKENKDYNSLNLQAELYNLFSSFLLVIRKSPEKSILFDNLLTGDISNYHEKISKGDMLLDIGKFVVVKGLGFQGAQLTLKEAGKIATKEGINQISKIGLGQAVANSAATVIKGINLPLTIGLGIAEVAFNMIALKVISGYYEGIIEF